MRRDPSRWRDGFPFDVPAVAAVERLDLDTPVTLPRGRQRQREVDDRGGHRGGDGLRGEPEAALSVSGSLALLAIVVRAARAGAQFIVATHSPILLACPEARIYELDEDGIAPCAYDDLDGVRLTRGFLDAPDRFIRAALEDPGP